MRERTARCCCGDFSIVLSGEPHYVHRCHCDYCQRRTGSVFQVSCWYPEAQVVSRKGDHRVYQAYPNLESSYAQSASEDPGTPCRNRYVGARLSRSNSSEAFSIPSVSCAKTLREP